MVLSILLTTGTATGDEASPTIRKQGNSFIAEYGAACMPHNDKTYGEVNICLRKFRERSSLDPILREYKFSSCYAQIKIDGDGNVTAVKLKKFDGIRALKSACKRTLFALKFYPIKKDGAINLKVSKVDFSMQYQAVKIKKVQTIGIIARAVLGNVWNFENRLLDQNFRSPIIVPPAKDRSAAKPE